MKKIFLFLFLLVFLSPVKAFCESEDDFKQEVQSAQSQMMNNPEIMNEIKEMMKDPELIKLMSDPELVKKVTSHDVVAIEADPKAQELMNHPKMKALLQKIQNSNITAN